MSSNNRKLNFVQAINEAFHQMMSADSRVFLMGQGVNSPWYIGNAAKGLLKSFGSQRVIDTPVSENAITGAAVGASLSGMRPVVVHPRMDFMFYAFDPIMNQAANWSYMNGGRISAPVVFWGIINRGGEQAAQHSQALQAMFAHVPGLKVVMPATPYDAKGLMISAIKDNNPVVYIDDRWLHQYEGQVPKDIYEVQIGKAAIRKEGNRCTLIASSFMTKIAEAAVSQLTKKSSDIEFIDLRTIKPFDKNALLESVKKTGRLVIVDGGWKSFGVAAEIEATIVENVFDYIKSPPIRVTLPDIPAPASTILEKAYYPAVKDIIDAVRAVLKA
jgi:pyruvate/2-oxoglutarate/acetoin dehydrogenase E1 component